MQITLDLNEMTYALISNEAKVKQCNLEDMVAEAVRKQYNPWEMDAEDAMEIEFEAYVQLHPDLYQLYPNQWVAIFGGKLIDHDSDIDTLEDRLIQNYPDATIFVDKVTSQIASEIVVRSPRFVVDDSTVILNRVGEKVEICLC